MKGVGDAPPEQKSLFWGDGSDGLSSKPSCVPPLCTKEAAANALLHKALKVFNGLGARWRVKRNRNANPENWWNINIFRHEIRRRTRAQQCSAEIMAHYQMGLGHKKIAALMGLSSGAVYRVIKAETSQRPVSRPRRPGSTQQLRAEI